MKTKIASVPKELRAAFQFFLRYAGYCTPPGRAACALSLAKAESAAQALGWSWAWEIDEAGCSGCDCGSEDCKCSSGEPHETFVCCLYDNSGSVGGSHVLASLCGICEPDAHYRRVVEAELASEARAEYEVEAANA